MKREIYKMERRKAIKFVIKLLVSSCFRELYSIMMNRVHETKLLVCRSHSIDNFRRVFSRKLSIIVSNGSYFATERYGKKFKIERWKEHSLSLFCSKSLWSFVGLDLDVVKLNNVTLTYARINVTEIGVRLKAFNLVRFTQVRSDRS